MERKARLILVSTFLILSLAGSLLFYRWIKIPDTETAGEEHLVQFSGSVSGLSVGSEVRFMGVAVGRVSSIELTPGESRRVNVRLGTREALPRTENLVALLEPQGITGLSVIELQDRPDIAPPTELYTGAIAGYPSVLSQLSGSASAIAGSVEDTLRRLSTLLDEDSVADLDATIRQSRELTKNLAGASRQLESLISSAANVSRQLEATVPDVRALAQRMNQEVIPSVVGAGQSLEAATRSISDIAAENREQIQRLLSQDLPTLIGITDQLAASLQQFSRLMDNINSEPGALLYGEKMKEVEIPRD
ncbi:MAG: phospholipid/cholesterol/gamma-HCH transport system substrate-binding protein [Halieaceae bacterium]|jgi:phospholipid/cholesterol/gamma-HCH transport system substrate-binding protein